MICGWGLQFAGKHCFQQRMTLTDSQSTSSLLLAFLIDFGMQFAFYIVSAIMKTEVLYDFSGFLTYTAIVITLMSTTGTGIWSTGTGTANGPVGGLAVRQFLLGTFVLVWTARLGIFLFIRVLSRKDDRFDELKTDPIKFAVPWFLQVVWIFISPLSVYVVLGNPASSQSSLIWSDYIGILVFIFGFSVETIADYQKQVFKKTNPRDFIQSGIWKYSRYANYFGEVVLWYGIFILSCAGVIESWQWVIVISPLFVNFLLYFGSGVALSEAGAQKRYGARQDFQLYCARTSKFFLWPPKQVTAVISN